MPGSGPHAAKAAPEGVLKGWLRARASSAAASDDTGNSAGPGAARHGLPTPSIERALAGALGRAAEQAGLRALVAEIDIRSLSLAEVIETLPDGGLIALAEGSSEALGVVALCPTTLSSLVEIEAIGRLRAEMPAPRRPTRTDAAIAAVFINHTLEEAASTTARLPDTAFWSNYRYASYLDDPRPLALMLDEIEYRCALLRLRLGREGTRIGTVMIALPGQQDTFDTAADMVGSRSRDGTPMPPALMRGEPVNLAASVAGAPITLHAVLTRRRVTLRELRSLEPGSILTLPGTVLSQASLETAIGQPLASGRLGERDGCYALCLEGPRQRDQQIQPVPDGRNGIAPVHGHHDGGALPEIGMPEPEPPIADLAEPDAFRLTETAGDMAFPAADLGGEEGGLGDLAPLDAISIPEQAP